ncbi:MAG TPA: hypothetical protein VN817_09365 [Solirubrobacteraceae bacterium]|nr:hypothetical protein [Solirubrobacteraceae bacterium]
MTLVLVLLLSLAAPAAFAGKPKGEYAPFTGCPLKTAGVSQCVYAQFTGGKLTFGSMTVPIERAITLQGGLIVTGTEETFVNAGEGETLTKTEEKVPGGFSGVGGTESSPMTLTLELVGAVALSRGNLAEAKGTALKLPVRAHLKNIYFGEECFLGSGASPITLNLTSGVTSPPAPNKPISGSAGTHEVKEGGNLVLYKGDSLVENAFSVPGAKGCGAGVYKELITPLINSKYGLPAAAGRNTAILSGTSEFASAEAVLKSE